MTLDPLSLAKITPPRMPAYLPRERLFRALDEKRGRPLIWLSGPAGSGKTTLVASYLQTHKVPCLWYRMDPGDGDLATFFYYLTLGARKAAPRVRKPLPLLTPEYMQGISVFALRFFENLFDRLKRGSLLVFDNYHSIPDESQFHEVIGEVFGAIPDGINVIAVSRHAHPRTFAGLHGNGLMNMLGWNDLRLTFKETAGIVRSRGERISPEAIRRLHQAADGWMVGLLLMLQSVRNLPHAPAGLSHDEIIDYFGTQIFGKLDAELRQFLLRTAFMPRITAKMAEELTGLPHSANLLSGLARNNYFTEKDSSAEPVYRYHQLLRAFLMARACTELRPGEIANLLAKSARLLESAGAIEDAAEILIQTADWDYLTRLILTQAPTLIAQGRHKVIGEWLEGFPPEIMSESPWLLYWKGACLVPSNPLQSAVYFEKAFRLFETQHDEAGTLLAWSGTVDSILFAWDDFTPLASWYSWLERWLHDHPSFPSPEIEARVAVSVTGICAWTPPSRTDPRKWFERSLRLSRETGSRDLQLQALSNSLFYFVWLGDTDKVHTLLEQVRALALSNLDNPLPLLVWKFAEGRAKALLSVGQYGAREAEEGIKLAEKTGIHTLDNAFYMMAAAAALCIGDMATAEEFLHRMETIAPRTPKAMASQNLYLAGLLHFHRGNYDRALALAAECLQVCIECTTCFPEILARQLIARILDKKGKYDEGLRQVAATKEILLRIGNPHLVAYFSQLDEALILFDSGDEAKALEALRSAMRTGMEHGSKTLILYWLPSLLARLCAKALQYDIEESYVHDLIRTLNLIPDTPPADIEKWPWAIRIHTLGKFQVRRNGSAIEFSRKAQKKPLDLLKALLALGGKEVREEVIADIVWPEATGDAAHHSFEVNLQRLRALLGHPQALQLREGRLSLDNRYCWVDLWAFEHYLDRAKNAKKTEIAVDAAQRAVEIYPGHFLAGETDEAWALSLREKLRSRFLGNVRWLGSHYEQAANWQDAGDCYQKGLEVDNLAEELYRRLMTCHLRLDQRAEAMSVYARCRKTLSLILDIAPSPETEKLYRIIKG